MSWSRSILFWLSGIVSYTYGFYSVDLTNSLSSWSRFGIGTLIWLAIYGLMNFGASLE